MTKKDEFLDELKKKMNHLPTAETEKILNYYSESLQDRIEEGMSEEEAINSFESTDSIVKNIEEEISLTAVVKDKIKTKTESSNVNKVLLILVILLGSPLWISILAVAFGLAIAAITLLWTIPIVIASFYFSLSMVAIAGIFSGFIRMFTISFSTGLAYLSVGIISAGLAVMFFLPMIAAGKWWIRVNIYPFKKLKQWLIKRA